MEKYKPQISTGSALQQLLLSSPKVEAPDSSIVSLTGCFIAVALLETLHRAVPF